MPTAQYSIPADLVQAFRTAIQAVHEWQRYGGAEPLVNYQGLPHPVSVVADEVAIFDDNMPDDLCSRICYVAGSSVPGPADQTYKAGALCLYRLCMKLKVRSSSLSWC
jgi:hypothetical protein